MTTTRLRRLLLGAPRNFRLSGSREDALAETIRAAVAAAAIDESPKIILLPRLTFTTTTVTDAPENIAAHGNVRVARRPSDGAYLEGERRAGAITLADCLAVCVWNKERLAVLHGGLKCLLPPHGEEGIIARTIRERAFDSAETYAWIGAGIGPCCYGLNWVPDGVPASARKKPTSGPRRNTLVSVDLRALAREHLLALGVPADHIEVDGQCTSCTQEQGTFPYWSHVRGDEERNIFIAWLNE